MSNVEIERKFLVKDDTWKECIFDEKHITQGYLSLDPERIVRVRIIKRFKMPDWCSTEAYLTIKGKGKDTGLAALFRPEYEFPLQPETAKKLMELCIGQPLIKVRHQIFNGNDRWDVDVFEQANAPLVLAEIELRTVDQVVDLPSWAGQEVTHDNRYANSYLIHTPYAGWSHQNG